MLFYSLSDTRQTTRDENNQSEKQTHKHTRYMADAEMLRVAAEIGARVEASHERGAWEEALGNELRSTAPSRSSMRSSTLLSPFLYSLLSRELLNLGREPLLIEKHVYLIAGNSASERLRVFSETEERLFQVVDTCHRPTKRNAQNKACQKRGFEKINSEEHSHRAEYHYEGCTD